MLSAIGLISANAIKRQAFGNGTAIILPTPVPIVYIYEVFIYVQIIVEITVVVVVYNVPVVRFIGGQYYTFTVPAQRTSSVINGNQTTYFIGPATAQIVPTVTTVLNGQTIEYVPSAGPSTARAAPSGGVAIVAPAPAPIFTYGVTNGICTCQLAVTITQFVTISVPTIGSPATGTPPATPPTTPPTAPPVNCKAPSIAEPYILFPGLIIPIRSDHANTSYGTQYTASIDAGQQVVLQYNVKTSGTCQVALALPPLNELTTSSYTLGGDNIFSLARLPVSVDSTFKYSGLPTDLDYTTFTAVAGTTVMVTSFNCVAGTPATFVLRAFSGASLTAFFDFNCPYVGLVIVD